MLVHRLCSRIRKQPLMLTRQHLKEMKLDKIKKAVVQITSDKLSKNRPIWKTDIIQKAVKEEYDEHISKPHIC